MARGFRTDENELTAMEQLGQADVAGNFLMKLRAIAELLVPTDDEIFVSVIIAEYLYICFAITAKKLWCFYPGLTDGDLRGRRCVPGRAPVGSQDSRHILGKKL